MTEVLVVIGAGGMGETIARRLAVGKKALIADFSEPQLARIQEEMTNDGFDVETIKVDVSSRESVTAVAARAAELGTVRTVVHTAGVSPTQAPLEAVLRVDLVGTALVLELFAPVIAPGGSGVVISSMSGHMGAGFTAEQEQAILSSTPEALLELEMFSAETLGHAGAAYSQAKRANRLQVQNAAHAWGAAGARINSISPGVISTAMGRLELDSPSGAFMRAMVEGSGTARFGTPSDIADAVTFLVGPHATFITGTDLLVDGGVVAALNTGHVAIPGH